MLYLTYSILIGWDTFKDVMVCIYCRLESMIRCFSTNLGESQRDDSLQSPHFHTVTLLTHSNPLNPLYLSTASPQHPPLPLSPPLLQWPNSASLGLIIWNVSFSKTLWGLLYSLKSGCVHVSIPPRWALCHCWVCHVDVLARGYAV